MHQQLWGYKLEEKLYLGVREQKRLNTTGLVYGPLPPGDNLIAVNKYHIISYTQKQVTIHLKTVNYLTFKYTGCYAPTYAETVSDLRSIPDTLINTNEM